MDDKCAVLKCIAVQGATEYDLHSTGYETRYKAQIEARSLTRILGGEAVVVSEADWSAYAEDKTKRPEVLARCVVGLDLQTIKPRR